MSTDKTLADAQPGGMVRLGDQAERARFEAFLSGNPLIALCAGTAWQVWQAALSAQPSPGGQGADLAPRIRGLAGLVEVARPHEAMKLRDIADELAARQPVGEPVAWKYRAPGVSFWRVSFRKPVNSEWECEPLCAAPPAQAVDLAPVTIQDTPEVRDILGRPNFWCSPWANVLRMRGDSIPRKAEEEQAAVIRFMLNHYLANGADWAETAGAELDAIRKANSLAVGNG